ncbi:MFS general substrate transporter [Protomyces lactucae-debilis]|uniref:MFS general substrate transporter n=1 Tax=Protomyces lactucae-debilis TaxID=2754530 RepID=A0A1Y2FSH3_PROLT|nr:MFS general substrate transporter [Protomyces lactucae-debilis]ORY86952.1 MFS general substrate transporter [Protomyces lactucae-debilis]
MPLFEKGHFQHVFIQPKGEYVNDKGETVHGRIPRDVLPNPIALCRKLTWSNWLYFIVGLAAWTMDGYDFHCVSLSVSRLATEFGVGREKISESITLTLLFRTVGAAVFGIAGDVFGRKWALIVNLIVIAVLQVGTAYAFDFNTFLAVRALFGIGMGGIWALSAAMALENMPVECRGLFSGVLQQGYALGYLIAAVFNLYIVPISPHKHRALFYIGAGLTGAVAIARLAFPESRQFIEAKEHGQTGGKKKMKAFITEGKVALKTEWKRVIYCSLLMAAFNFMSHSSQDLYPTFLQQGKAFSAAQASRATIIAKTGCIVGGCVVGYLSQRYGRRASIFWSAILGCCFIPLWVIPQSWGALVAGAFLLQFCVQGAFGVVPIHLSELSPEAFRATFPGITYQIGNMISSPAAQILTTIAEKNKVRYRGKLVPGYAATQGVMQAIIFLSVAGLAIIGPEFKGRQFEKARALGDSVAAEKLAELDELERSDSEGQKAPQYVHKEMK